MYEVGGLVSGAVASTALALAGLDGEALVLGQMAGALVNAVLVIGAATYIRPRWSREAASGILRFGAPAAGSSLMNTAFRNVDYAILAVVLSPTAVGYYFRAYRLGVEYQLKVARVMQRVSFPIYSRAGSLERLRSIRQRIVRVQAVVCVPALGLFIVVAPELVPWLFGPTWEPAVVPAQILAVVGMIGTMLAGIGPLILGAGRPGSLLIYNIFYTVTYAGIVLATAQYGLKTVCFGVIGAQLLNLVAAHWFLLKRIAGIPMRSTIEDAAPAVVPTVAILALCTPLEAWLSDTSLPTIVTLTVVSIVALGVGPATLRLFARSTWDDVTLVANRVVGRRRSKASAGRGRHTAPVEA
jgi:O-antigen/teichoic acid export membrane protein